ncbi:hypothetical protein [Endozoicomonas atrinae]|uniref:hypothetical protein n=1 Tax=Endozoicomonas atrinae TaxID=1333660 RepID=UPI0008265F37|nr:hypothetical protein [Endozoicomonas atrinae]
MRTEPLPRALFTQLNPNLSSLSKSLYQRSVLLIETVSPYIKSISAGLSTLKSYSIRVVICSTAIVKETTKGLGLGLSAGTVSSFLLSPFPTIVVIAPTIQLAATVIGGIGGFLHGVELAQVKWEERVEKERMQS